MKTLLLTIVLLSGNFWASAQNFRWFSKSEISKASLAEMYSPINKIELVKTSKIHSQYYKGKKISRPINEVQYGFRLPLFALEKRLTGGHVKASADMPLSALLSIDMYESETAPVINTDYRFGLEYNMAYYPESLENGFVKNFNLRWVPLFHESTHIGDEYALHGYIRVPDFMRINLSYEAWQLFLGINSPDTLSGLVISAEFGYQGLAAHKAGFYNPDTVEVQNAPVSLGEARNLWLLRLNLQNDSPFMTQRMARLIFSAEIRNEIKFGYTADNPEQRVWSINAVLGHSMCIANSERRAGFFLRYYYGLTPYGQLRDEYDFQLFGAGIFIR